jgi:hypothetical protein
MQVHDGYVQVTMTLNVKVDPGNSLRIWKWTAGVTDYDNGTFTYDDKPGFKDTYSANPDSADYDPANYNRCLALLHEQGIATDIPLAPLASRRLRDRWGMWSVKLRRQILAASSGTWQEWAS